MSETGVEQPQTAERDWWGEEGESWVTGSAAKQRRLEVYLEWLLTPKAERRPSTKRELAEVLGVTTQTLRNYAKDPWLQRELLTRQRTVFRVEKVGPVLDSLYAQATDPENRQSVSAARTLLEWINKSVEPSLPTDMASMSDEELAEAAQSMIRGTAASDG
jgi:hypothetical protein